MRNVGMKVKQNLESSEKVSASKKVIIYGEDSEAEPHRDYLLDLKRNCTFSKIYS